MDDLGYSFGIVAGRRGRQRGSIDPPVVGGCTGRFLNQPANRAAYGLNAVLIGQQQVRRGTKRRFRAPST